MERYYNRGKQQLPPLYAGMPVAIQNRATKRWDRVGWVQEAYHQKRRYLVRLTSGMLIQRNRHALRRRYPNDPADSDADIPVTPTEPRVERLPTPDTAIPVTVPQRPDTTTKETPTPVNLPGPNIDDQPVLVDHSVNTTPTRQADATRSGRRVKRPERLIEQC